MNPLLIGSVVALVGIAGAVAFMGDKTAPTGPPSDSERGKMEEDLDTNNTEPPPPPGEPTKPPDTPPPGEPTPPPDSLPPSIPPTDPVPPAPIDLTNKLNPFYDSTGKMLLAWTEERTNELGARNLVPVFDTNAINIAYLRGDRSFCNPTIPFSDWYEPGKPLTNCDSVVKGIAYPKMGAFCCSRELTQAKIDYLNSFVSEPGVSKRDPRSASERQFQLVFWNSLEAIYASKGESQKYGPEFIWDPEFETATGAYLDSQCRSQNIGFDTYDEANQRPLRGFTQEECSLLTMSDRHGGTRWDPDHGVCIQRYYKSQRDKDRGALSTGTNFSTSCAIRKEAKHPQNLM